MSRPRAGVLLQAPISVLHPVYVCQLNYLYSHPNLSCKRVTCDVQVFFFKYNDPSYVKVERVDVMVMLASERNVDQVRHRAVSSPIPHLFFSRHFTISPALGSKRLYGHSRVCAQCRPGAISFLSDTMYVSINFRSSPSKKNINLIF